MSVVSESSRLESMETTLLSPRDVALEPAAAADMPSAGADLRPAWCLLAAPIAVAFAVAALVVAVGGAGATATQVIGAVLVTLWTLAGLSLGVRRRHDRLGPIVLAGAALAGGLCLAQAVGTRDDLQRLARRRRSRGAAARLPAAGRLTAHADVAARRTAQDPRPPAGCARRVRRGTSHRGRAVPRSRPPHGVADRAARVAALAIGVAACHQRYLRAGAEERRRIQWIGWGLVVTAEAVLVIIALRLLSDWPDSPGAAALAITSLIPLSVIAGTFPKLVARVDRLLTHTVALAGLTALVLAVYVVVVLGLGRTPSGGERSLLLLSMLAAGICALLYLPARHWLTARANRMVYGERVAPDETLRTFGQRLTRSIPLDELMLQLAENLRKSMILTSAEIWTGKDGYYDLMAGVPHRQPAPVEIGTKERAVVARAGVSGGTWLDIWVPQLVVPTGSASMRVAPVAHGGMLLGFIVVTRRPDGEPFTESEDMVLTELARQIGLALHNVQLDTALQASLDQLRQRNQELQESRGAASWPPATPSAASSSATCTTAPNSTSWRWLSSCAWPTTRSKTTPTTRWR